LGLETTPGRDDVVDGVCDVVAARFDQTEFGVPERLDERVFGNVYSGFQLISRNHNDLAFANLRQCLRPFAGFCRFFYFNGTRNDTRRERLPKVTGIHLVLDRRSIR